LCRSGDPPQFDIPAPILGEGQGCKQAMQPKTTKRKGITMKTETTGYKYEGYKPGHPWYYYKGGRIPTLKQILSRVKAERYQGYRISDILSADNKPEPQRSEALRRLQAEELRLIRHDISRYRELARLLHRYRKTQDFTEARYLCDNIHTSISLKYNHIYNRFAHLIALEDLLSQQPDLFDF
jgi:hypothetical protein